MPTVCNSKTGKWKITMYFGDHNPPHFHIVSANGEALVEIETMTVIAGSVSPAILRAALKWSAANREILRNRWVLYHL